MYGLFAAILCVFGVTSLIIACKEQLVSLLIISAIQLTTSCGFFVYEVNLYERAQIKRSAQYAKEKNLDSSVNPYRGMAGQLWLEEYNK